jgi:DNA replication and repair protein RecF
LDIESGRTSVGPHKDDYEFCLNNQALKQYGSQGQQKSYLVALKLAQFQILETSKQIKPIFLLDDIFDKLDVNRIQALLQLISSNSFGQIFITDAQRLRCEQWLPNISAEVNFIELPIL